MDKSPERRFFAFTLFLLGVFSFLVPILYVFLNLSGRIGPSNSDNAVLLGVFLFVFLWLAAVILIALALDVSGIPTPSDSDEFADMDLDDDDIDSGKDRDIQDGDFVYCPSNFFEPSDKLTKDMAREWNDGIQKEYGIPGYGGSLENWELASTAQRQEIVNGLKERVREESYGLLISAGEDFPDTEDISERLAKILRGLVFGTEEQWKLYVQELCSWIEDHPLSQIETGWGFASYKDGQLKAWRTKGLDEGLDDISSSENKFLVPYAKKNRLANN